MAAYYDTVVAVDWLGMGCSDRKGATQLTKISSTSNEQLVRDQAEKTTQELLAGLEEVRQQECVDSFVLAGHSLGGYLTAKYALQHSNHLQGVVLLSPAGVPEPPDHEKRATDDELDWKIRLLMSLWNMNLTPQMLVRLFGNSGRRYVDNYFKRRLMTSDSQWTNEEMQLLSEYLFHITAGADNGEYALNALLQPIFVSGQQNVRGKSRNSDRIVEGESAPLLRSGVYARNAVEQAIDSQWNKDVPLLLLFGDSDWLYFPTAPHVIRRWKDKGIDAELVIVKDADHHLHLQNADDVNRIIIDWSKRHFDLKLNA